MRFLAFIDPKGTSARGRIESDVWNVALKVDFLSHGKKTELLEHAVIYTTGSGQRVYNNFADAPLPAEPRLESILQSLGNDASLAEDMPRNSDAAVNYVMQEFGYSDAQEARRIVNAVVKLHDALSPALKSAGTNVPDFVDWARSDALEVAPPRERGEFRLTLPEVTDDSGTGHRGEVTIRITQKGGVGKLTTNLESLGDGDFAVVSFTGQTWRKQSDERRFSGASAGQCNDDMRANWGHLPAVAEILDSWDQWHLNDMKAGTQLQSEALAATGSKGDFTESLRVLDAAGLKVDRGYSYGSKWLHEVVPAEELERILGFASLTAHDLAAPAPSGPAP